MLKIVTSVNDNYLVPLTNLLRSLRVYGKVEFSIIHLTVPGSIDKLSEEFLKELSHHLKFNLEFYDMKNLIEELPVVEDFFLPIQSLTRLLIPKLPMLCENDSVWFFDADMLVLRPLSILDEIDSDCAIAAVPESSDCSNWEAQYFPQIDSKFWYFNAGLLRFNLKTLTQSDSHERILNTTSKYSDLEFHMGDQDILNYVYPNDYFPIAWNMNAGPSTFKNWKQISVAHYYGQLKPWQWSKVPNCLTLRRDYLQAFIGYYHFSQETTNFVNANFSKELSDYFLTLREKLILTQRELFFRRIRHLMNVGSKLRALKNYSLFIGLFS